MFERMTANYGHAWVSVMGLSPQHEGGRLTLAGETWAAALSGLTGEQLALGLKTCLLRGQAFPPNAGEFRALCLAIPTLGKVRADLARADAERQPFTVMVLRRLDLWRYKHAEGRVQDRMLDDAYADAREALMAGEPLPEALVAIGQDTARPFTPADPAAVASYLERIRQELQGVCPGEAEA